MELNFYLFFRKFSLLIIGCYHLFWNDNVEHEAAIECISCIVDYAAVNLPYESYFRILLIGDFNDLHKYFDVISGSMNLKHIIAFHTRNDKTIDSWPCLSAISVIAFSVRLVVCPLRIVV